jgi:hypothetical protein
VTCERCAATLADMMKLITGLEARLSELRAAQTDHHERMNVHGQWLEQHHHAIRKIQQFKEVA